MCTAQRVHTPKVTIMGALLLLLLPLSAGTTAAPYQGALEQAPPRAIATNLKLPAEATLGPVIAGLSQGAVPQGMTTVATVPPTIITSHYADDGGPSRLVLTNWLTGTSTATWALREPDGATHTGHVGGIAADQHSLWVASDAYLYRGDITPLLSATSGGVYQLDARHATEATYEVAFCAVYDELVWAGEFALADKYPTDPTHHLTAPDGSMRRGWISAYNPALGFAHPEKVLSVPDRAQGMWATDELIYLSISYGRRHRSHVEVHRNPLASPPDRITQTSKGKDVPLWFLDENTRVRTIDLPPMAQNLVIIDRKLAVLFESGAAKFRFFGKKPLDYIVLLPLHEGSQ